MSTVNTRPFPIEHDALTAILSEVVVIDEDHKLDLLVGGYERIAAHFTPPAATGETPRTDAETNNVNNAYNEWACSAHYKDPSPEIVSADFAHTLERENSALREELENEKARGIHTCHGDCQRPLCVANRKLTAAEAEKHRLLAQIVTLMDEKEASESRVKELVKENARLIQKLSDFTGAA